MLHQVVNNFHLLRGLVMQMSSKILLCVSLEVEPGPCPKAALLSLGGFSLFSTSPPFPDQQLFEPALWNSGKVKKWGTQKGFCAQEHHKVLFSFNINSLVLSMALEKVVRQKSENTICTPEVVSWQKSTEWVIPGTVQSSGLRGCGAGHKSKSYTASVICLN